MVETVIFCVYIINTRDDRGNAALMYAKNEAKEEIVSLEGAVEVLINHDALR